MYSYLDPINLNNWGFFDSYVERKDAVNEKCVQDMFLKWEQRNSCRPIALAWPRLDGLIQLFKHYFKIVPLSTNKLSSLNCKERYS